MFFKKLRSSSGFEERLKAWDDCICGERGRVSEESMVATRTNTVPIAFQEVGQDDSEAVFQEFLKSSTFANIWNSVPSLLSSPGSDSGGSALSSGQSTPQLVGLMNTTLRDATEIAIINRISYKEIMS